MRDIRILVVDDSKVGRLTLAKKLEPLGARVDTAESGQEALDYLARARPDVIFMDHMMPGMDGLETTRRIKASPATSGIPVIVVSGNEGDEFVMEARAAGAADAIVKPPAPGVLETILGTLPARGAGPAPSTPLSPISPEPVPVPSSVPPLDRATVHAWVDGRLAGAMTHLRDELMAELRRAAAEAADAGKHMHTLEQRLQAVEARTGKPLPDLDAMRQALQAQLEDHRARLAQYEQRLGGLDSSLNALSADVGRLAEEARTAQAALAPDAEMPAPQAPAGAGDSRLQAELVQLKGKVKALAFMLAMGGVALLATLGMLIFRG